MVESTSSLTPFTDSDVTDGFSSECSATPTTTTTTTTDVDMTESFYSMGGMLGAYVQGEEYVLVIVDHPEYLVIRKG